MTDHPPPAAQAEIAERLAQALNELVQLKALKERFTRPSIFDLDSGNLPAMRRAYEARKPSAWSAAEVALAAYRSTPSSAQAEPCAHYKPGACASYDRLLGEIFKDKAVVEQALFDAANGKKPMPDAQQLRELALLLGHAGPLLQAHRAAQAEPAASAPPRQAPIWGEPRELQMDSFATGRPQAGMAHLMGDYIHVEVTDGRESWAGKIPLPKGWNP